MPLTIDSLVKADSLPSAKFLPRAFQATAVADLSLVSPPIALIALSRTAVAAFSSPFWGTPAADASCGWSACGSGTRSVSAPTPIPISNAAVTPRRVQTAVATIPVLVRAITWADTTAVAAFPAATHDAASTVEATSPGGSAADVAQSDNSTPERAAGQ